MKILMVCLGNICRSPLAEGILKHKVYEQGLKWVVDSAGTNGYHVGEAPHRLSQKVARVNGIDISHQKARKFVKEDFDRYDKIYALSSDVLEDMVLIGREKFDPSKAALLTEELFPGSNMDVPDPWYGPEKGYHEAFEMIDRACEKIIQKYSVTSLNFKPDF
jgi:protein-tyrosine phosphatase